MRVAGIDPGLRGAIVILEDGEIIDRELLVNVTVRPWLQQRFTKIVYIEQAQSMPKQGIVSAFNYGLNFGYLLGTLSSGFIVNQVPARTWTKRIHKQAPRSKCPKTRSLWVARHVWPKETWLASERSRVPHDGLIDAALIAMYGHLCEQLIKHEKIPVISPNVQVPR